MKNLYKPNFKNMLLLFSGLYLLSQVACTDAETKSESIDGELSNVDSIEVVDDTPYKFLNVDSLASFKKSSGTTYSFYLEGLNDSENISSSYTSFIDGDLFFLLDDYRRYTHSSLFFPRYVSPFDDVGLPFNGVSGFPLDVHNRVLTTEKLGDNMYWHSDGVFNWFSPDSLGVEPLPGYWELP